jgi:hypothetical protein
LTLAHKDLLTFYLEDRKSPVFRTLGIFGEKFNEVRSYLKIKANMKGRDIVTEAQERAKFTKYEERAKNDVADYKQSWIVSWLADMTNNFHFLIEHVDLAIDVPFMYVKESEPKQPRKQTDTTIKTLKKFKNGILELVESKPQKPIGEYMKLLSELPFYEKFIIGTNDDMEYVDFNDEAIDVLHHHVGKTFCYRINYGSFNDGPPAYRVNP